MKYWHCAFLSIALIITKGQGQASFNARYATQKLQTLQSSHARRSPNATYIRGVENFISKYYGCNKYPALTNITHLLHPRWNFGCVYGLMAATNSFIYLILEVAEHHVRNYKSLELIIYNPSLNLYGHYLPSQKKISLESPYGWQTLIHELTHYVMTAVFKNAANPFRKLHAQNEKYELVYGAAEVLNTAQSLLQAATTFKETLVYIFKNFFQKLFYNFNHYQILDLAEAIECLSCAEPEEILAPYKNTSLPERGTFFNKSERHIVETLRNIFFYPLHEYVAELIARYPQLLLTRGVNAQELDLIYRPFLRAYYRYVRPELISSMQCRYYECKPRNLSNNN